MTHMWSFEYAYVQLQVEIPLQPDPNIIQHNNATHYIPSSVAAHHESISILTEMQNYVYDNLP